MSTPHNQARVLAVLRGTWTEYLVDNGCKLTQESAKDFLASAHDALGTLADEIRTKLRLGVATEVRVFWEENTWYTAVYFQDRRAKRCDLGEYLQMSDDASEEDMRRAVVEATFVHNVNVQVNRMDQFASWGEAPRDGDCESPEADQM